VSSPARVPLNFVKNTPIDDTTSFELPTAGEIVPSAFCT
jgi:hypothetical protein